MAKKPLTKKQLREKIRLEDYKRQAKKLRATNAFGDLFKAKGGVDFRSPKSWSPAVKSRITRYAKELGPLLASPTKTKRYYRPDHLRSAIEVTGQEKMLKGQKAALFPVDDLREDIEITFDKKHRAHVKRGGIVEQRIYFDPNEMTDADSIMAEVERTLDAAPGKFFKFITGANASKGTFNDLDLLAQLDRMILNYDPDEKPIGDFLYGIKAYPNIRAKTRLTKRDAIHQEKVKARERERLRKLSNERKALTKAEKASMRRGRVK